MAHDTGFRQARWRAISHSIVARRSGFERYQWTLRALVALTDAVVIAASIGLALLLRQSLTFFPEALDVESNVDRIAPALVALWVAVLWAFRSYSERSMGAGTREYQRVLVASTSTAGMVGIASFLTQYPLSRGFFVLAFALGTAFLLVERFAIRRVIHSLRMRDRLTHSVILVGAPGHVDAIATVLGRERWLGFRVLGAAVPPEYGIEDTPRGVPVLGTTGDLIDAVDRTSPSAVIFVGGYPASPGEVRARIWELEGRRVGTFVVPSITDVADARLSMQPIGGLPLVHVAAPYAPRAAHLPKRALDVVGSALLLLVTAPLMAVVSLAVKLGDGGPVTFRQPRVGRNGRLFDCLKIRTMVPNAEALEDELRRAHNGPDDVLFKLADDPRITRVGRFLRRYSIDELPQLWNVLCGHMSLVGPRPALPHEVARFTEEEKRRLRVRPGLSGLWQVSGRSNLSREDAARLDLYYVENWSMMQDLSILLRTVRAVLSSEGAY